MCLLTAVEYWDAERIECRGVATEDPAHPLRHGGLVAPVHAIEYAAQAIAVHGALTAEAGDTAARPGMIANVRDVQWPHTATALADGPPGISCTAESVAPRFCRYAFVVTDGAGDSVTGRIMIVFGDQ